MRIESLNFVAILFVFVLQAHGQKKLSLQEEIKALKTELASQLDPDLKISDKSLSDAEKLRTLISKNVAEKPADTKAIKQSLASGSTRKSLFGLLGSSRRENEEPEPILGQHRNVAPEANFISANIFADYDDDEEGEEELPVDEVATTHVNKTGKATGSFEMRFNHSSHMMVHLTAAQRDGVSREVLELKDVQERIDFNVGYSVEKWKILRKDQSSGYTLIGMTKDGVVLISEQKGVYRRLQKVDLHAQPATLDAYVEWEERSESRIGIVLVAVPGEIVWLETRDQFEGLAETWRWNIQKNVLAARQYDFQGINTLLLITESLKGGSYSADIYEFDYEKKEFWLAQVIGLQSPAKSVSVLHTGTSFMVCIPQKDAVLVYRYEKTTLDRSRLVLKDEITSENITTISGFQMGGNSYLAIGGRTPQILRYFKGHFWPQTILSNTFELVIQWLPIPARTYRDDLILLVQHNVHFATHTLQAIEALIWNGEAFDVSPTVPCYHAEEIDMNGLTCMLDEERELGLYGADFVQNQETITLIVPRHDAPSGLFNLHFDIVSSPDPELEELEEIKKRYEVLAKVVEFQDGVVMEAVEAISHTLKPDEDNFVSAQWEIEHLEAPEVIELKEVQWEQDSIEFGDKKWTRFDSSLYIPTIEEVVEENRRIFDNLDAIMETSRRNRDSETQLNSPVHSLQVPINGQFNADQISLLSVNGRKRRLSRTTKPSEVKRLEVEELIVETINGIPVSELVFGDNGAIHLDGRLIFEKSLRTRTVEAPKVNGVDFKESFVHFSHAGPIVVPLTFEEIESKEGFATSTLNGVDMDPNAIEKRIINHQETDFKMPRLDVNGNVSVSSINGVSWDNFLSSLVIKSFPTELSELHVQGDLIIENKDVKLFNLNSMKFPDDLVFSSGVADSSIAGRKTFKNGLFTTQVTSETINDINTMELITLDQPQDISGHLKFAALEVTHNLEIAGKIDGPRLSHFLPNPTLIESKIIDSACIFRNLRVDGPVIVEQNLNGAPFEETLANVVVSTPEGITISAPKHFSSAEMLAGVEITDGLLNGHPLDSFVTKSTTQELSFTDFSGDILISDLQLSGLFDGVNVTNLDQQAIRLSGDQYTEAELIFDRADDFEPSLDAADVEAESLQIRSTLNALEPERFIRTDQDFSLDGDIAFEELFVDEASVLGDVIGHEVLNGVDLRAFEQRRFSLTRPQTITTQCSVKTGTVVGNLKTEHVNDVDTLSFQHNLMKAQHIRNLLFSGDIQIKNLFVDGNAAVKMINGRDLNELLETVVWLNKPNQFEGEISFLDGVRIEKNLTYYGFVNRQLFKSFVRDLALKSDDLQVSGVKVFKEELKVLGDLQTDQINTISIEDIVTKTGPQHLKGSLKLLGDLKANQLEVDGLLNNVSLEQLKSIYAFDAEGDFHTISADVVFGDFVKIRDLKLESSFNQLKDISAFLASIVRMDQSANISGIKTFTKPIYLRQGFKAETFNGVDLRDLLEEIVLIDSERPQTIFGVVEFKRTVEAPSVNIWQDLVTTNIADCNPQEWIYSGILINRDVELAGTLYFPPETFYASELITNNLNGYPMRGLVTLHTEQDNIGKLFIEELVTSAPIHVGQSVNGLNLRYERENTLMTYGPQLVNSSLSIQSARVLGYLQLDSLNGEHTNNLALLDSTVHLQSPLFFKSVEASAVVTEDHISGVDFNHWHDTALRTEADARQLVVANWTVEELVLRHDLNGNGLINGVDITRVVENLENSRKEVDDVLVGFANEYQAVCDELRGLADRTKSSVYFFKYFEHAFDLEAAEAIGGRFEFRVQGGHFLLVNAGCWSVVYRWSPAKQAFEKVADLSTGKVSALVEVDDEHLALLASDCGATSGVYRFNGTALELVAALKDDLKALRKDKGKFYALGGHNKVFEFDARGQVQEEWLIPSSGEERQRFLPPEANLGLALSDGRKLSILTSMKSANRRRRRDDAAGEENLITGEDKTNDKRTFGKLGLLPKLLDKTEVGRRRLIFKFITTSPEPPVLPEGVPDFSYLKRPEESFDIRSEGSGDDGGIATVGLNEDFVEETENETSVEEMENEEVELEKESTEGPSKLLSSTMASVDPAVEFTNGPEESSTLSTLKSLVSTLFTPLTGPLEQFSSAEEEEIDQNSIESQTRSTTKRSEKVSVPSDTPEPPEVEKSSTEAPLEDLRSAAEEQDHTTKGPEESTTQASTLSDLLDDFKNADLDTTKGPEESSTTRKSPTTTVDPLEGLLNVDPDQDSGFPDSPDAAIEIFNVDFSTPTPNNVPSTTPPSSPLFRAAAAVPSDVQILPDIPKVVFSNHSATLAPSPATTERSIASIIPVGGVVTADNPHLPAAGQGEIIVLRVGIHFRQRTLIAVSTRRPSTVPGKHDLIQIYEDVLEAKLFQSIPCHRPSGLSAVHIKDETLLAFLEDGQTVRVFVYRGILGFVADTQFGVSSPVSAMATVGLPQRRLQKCNAQFLMLTSGRRLQFYKARTEPEEGCSLDVDFECKLN